SSGPNSRMGNRSQTKRLTPVGLIFALLGVVVFVYFVWKANPTEILANIKQLGAGFLIVIAISALRPIVRAIAWTRCFEGPERLRFIDAFSAYLIGDAVGTLVPLGIVVSEPTKAAIVRDRVPLLTGLSALAIENIFYSLSVALFIFAGTVALLLSHSVRRPLLIVSICAMAIALLLIAVSFLIIKKQWRFLSGSLGLVARSERRRDLFQKSVDRMRALEDRVYGFYARNRSRVFPILLLEAGFHISGILEVYTVLYFITDQPLLLTAFVLESVNRVINVVFKFVPLRLGVDEAGSGWITEVLKLGRTTGVTLAIVRKARIVCWTAIGVILLVRRGLSLQDVVRGGEKSVAES
ncbi:MAG: lysylphosphatidylglycerol synthase domain-containing protein, partial [Pyrinomonadaceae bacterium]